MILLDTHVAVWMTTGTSFGKRGMTIVKKALAQDRLANKLRRHNAET